LEECSTRESFINGENKKLRSWCALRGDQDGATEISKGAAEAHAASRKRSVRRENDKVRFSSDSVAQVDYIFTTKEADPRKERGVRNASGAGKGPSRPKSASYSFDLDANFQTEEREGRTRFEKDQSSRGKNRSNRNRSSSCIRGSMLSGEKKTPDTKRKDHETRS